VASVGVSSPPGSAGATGPDGSEEPEPDPKPLPEPLLEPVPEPVVPFGPLAPLAREPLVERLLWPSPFADGAGSLLACECVDSPVSCPEGDRGAESPPADEPAGRLPPEPLPVVDWGWTVRFTPLPLSPEEPESGFLATGLLPAVALEDDVVDCAAGWAAAGVDDAAGGAVVAPLEGAGVAAGALGAGALLGAGDASALGAGAGSADVLDTVSGAGVLAAGHVPLPGPELQLPSAIAGRAALPLSANANSSAPAKLRPVRRSPRRVRISPDLRTGGSPEADQAPRIH
jgi:hypothetical protein